jgi:hypothetical protein
MGSSMGSLPQKHKGIQKFFFNTGFCRARFAGHFDKKKFPVSLGNG